MSKSENIKHDREQAAEANVQMERFLEGRRILTNDVVAVEEPLEIRVVFGPIGERRSRSLSITMRTPGHDLELAVGFLLSEGLVNSPQQITSHEFCGPAPKGSARGNTLLIELADDVEFDTAKLQRHFYTTSSCGVCGKASLDAIRAQGLQACPDSGWKIPPDLIGSLPDRLRQQQCVFDQTGGLHAAGLFCIEGELLELREDVGRHNAVDKLLGQQLLSGQVPLSQRLLVVSGRASFELVQKALVGQVPMLIAVGAPSSLAVEMAKEFNMTLVGFTTKTRFNVYAGSSRIES